MTKLLTTLLLFLLFSCGNPAPKPSEKTTVLDTQTIQDLGKVAYGREKHTEFTIKNTGDVSLLIMNIKASCGCTEPTWDKAPVKPGETATIKVGFKAESFGMFRRSLQVHYNGEDSPLELIVSGEMVEREL